MTPGKDELDREIDAVLASMMKEEPRRVSAVSVRQALEGSRPVRWPLWLAAAAVVVVGLAIALITRQPVEVGPAQVVLSSPSPEPARSVPSHESVVSLSTALVPPIARSRTSRSQVMSEPDGGLPRLVIASLERPEPLAADLIASDVILIPLIDIAPLAVPTLSAESEPHQEKPKP